MGADTRRRASGAPKRKGAVSTVVTVLVLAIVIYAGVRGGVDKLPGWLRPIATAIVGGSGGAETEQASGGAVPGEAAGQASSDGAVSAPTGAPASAPAKSAAPAADAAPATAPKEGAAPAAKPADAPAQQAAPRPRQTENIAPKPAPAETRPIPKGSYHAEGRVIKLLPDDNDGIRHQRFLIRLADGSTLLVVHNVDVAPRLDDLAAGDDVEVCGEFVDNDRGGLVHWTHRATGRSRHPAGWIRHGGRIYE